MRAPSDLLALGLGGQLRDALSPERKRLSRFPGLDPHSVGPALFRPQLKQSGDSLTRDPGSAWVLWLRAHGTQRLTGCRQGSPAVPWHVLSPPWFLRVSVA